MSDMTSRLLTLVNSYTPMEMRETCLAAVKAMIMLWPTEMLNILVPMLHRAHATAASEAVAAAAGGDDGGGGNVALGPYFPRKGSIQLASLNLKTVRPPRPMLQVSVPTSQIESPHGLDPEYDRALVRYFNPYHTLVDFMVRLAVNEDNLSKMLVDLSAMVGLEGVPLHMQLFPKLWLDIFNTEVRRKGNYNLYLTLSQTTSKMLLM
jgi:ubiquitin carboxyl-terminal hydrolase 34